MSELINCIECGESISSKAKLCPNCAQYPKPFGRCFLCNRVTRLSERDTLVGNHYVHRKCIDSLGIKNNLDVQQFSCPTCHNCLRYTSFNVMTLLEGHKCTQCGEPLYFVKCDFCSSIVINKEVIDVQIHKSAPLDDVTKKYHPSCYSIISEHNPYIRSAVRTIRIPQAEPKTIVPNSNKEKKEDRCFIATAVYGSPFSSEVIFLKKFRDTILSSHPTGQKLIAAYYRVSPKLLPLLKKSILVRKILQHGFLEPLIWMLRKRYGE